MKTIAIYIYIYRPCVSRAQNRYRSRYYSHRRGKAFRDIESEYADRLISSDCRKNFRASIYYVWRCAGGRWIKYTCETAGSVSKWIYLGVQSSFWLRDVAAPLASNCNADTWKRIRAIPTSQTTFPAIKPEKWRRRRLLYRGAVRTDVTRVFERV